MSDVVLEAKPILERFRLDGKTALVTGGAQGIGRAFAHALADAGASVAIVDLDLPLAEEVCGELTAKGVEAIAVRADVTQPDDVNAMIDTIMKKWGKLTIGVNNAGIGQWVNSEEMTIADWNRMLGINLNGVFLCAQAEGKVMIPARYGKIINTASMSGHIVNLPQNQAAYNTSKAGVLHFTRSLATEWAQFGVRVNSISPGYTRTKLVDDLLATPIGKQMMPVWMERTPMKVMAEVTDLQGALIYLASEASDFATGTDIIIDGGYCAW
jgi:NAD(P)-dependent dehydrogenase (short-subunit alcohol dehydrogenase family)